VPLSRVHISIRWMISAMLLIVLSASATAKGQETPAESPADSIFSKTNQPAVVHKAPAGGDALPLVQTPPLSQPMNLPDLSKRETFSSALQLVILLTVLSLAPAILIMMTSFTRIIIVLSLLRQAMGTQQLPPNQILIGLSMFMTFLVMGPTWQRVNNEALQPYMAGNMEQKQALETALVPLREFMGKQIKVHHNDDDVLMFAKFAKQARAKSNPATTLDRS